MTTVRLGTQPIAWANDDLPELGGDTPVERILSEAKQAGYSGIEKGGRFPGDPGELKPLMARHGLQLITGWFSGELRQRSLEAEQQAVWAHLDLLVAMGSPVLVYAETTGTVQGQLDTPLAERPRMPEAEFGAYGEKLTRLAEWMRGEGIAMAFHHHMGTVIETEREIDLLMANTGEAVGLLFDTGHLSFAGGDVVGTLRRHGARVNHFHAKNIRPVIHAQLRNNRWSFLKGVIEGVFTVPGDPEGSVAFREIVPVLAEIGYSGWMVVEAEQDPVKAHPLTYARMGHAELVACCQAAGLTIVE
ncbi:myo-inosose-2 dehydratase [Geminicoccus flavidas]|uniref:myo-inosose-2 dehydratase n=1 Tax=Geminicoccus flavidas TaxID=2506407 RepID=UPI001358D740|nr:myo-inosose-2 dehydratase [Geminicoccus flavidas]